MLKISFVIPAYNSKETIENVITEIEATLINSYEYTYEIIAINDGSKDETFEILKKIAKKNSKLKVINLSKNFGQHAAIITGLNYVSGDICVCLDDDGQTPANECLKLVKEIENGKDVVYAKYVSKKHSIFRNLGSRVNDLMTCWLLEKPKDLYISSYFACRKYIVKEIIKYKNPYPYLQGLVLRTTKNISNVEVNHRKREIGKSNYSLFKLINLWLNGFTSFSIKPLRITSFLGFLCSLFGFIYGIVLIALRLNGKIVIMGYSSIMAVILFVNGIIMVILGLIGEYIGRIFISINCSPQYVIKETVNIDYESTIKKNN